MKRRTQSLTRAVSYVSRNFIKLCLLWIFSLSSLAIQAQENKKISIDMKGETLEAVLWYLQQETKLVFMYATEDIANITDITIKAKDKTAIEILDECLDGSNLKYEVTNGVVVITKRDVQNVTISGWIHDAGGEALPGASVTARGMKYGTVAGLDGNYSFKIPAYEGLILTFSFMGMETKVVRYTGKNTINVTLYNAVKEIDEVIVTGYQNIQRRDLVGSLTTVKAEDILMPSYSTIDQMLQGRVAGLMVTNTSSRAGATPKIKIRGTNTLLGNQDPLWVVDGIIQEDFAVDLDENSNVMTENLEDIIGNQISWLNPADIENITVLKDASATAIYGSKASNGVIEITTKKNTTDRMSINYSSNFNIGQRPNYGMFNMMNSQERLRFSQEAFEAGTPYYAVPYKEPYTYEGLLRMYQEHDISEAEYRSAYGDMERRNTDWLKLLTRRAFSHNHNLSLTGGTNKFNYTASVGYTNAEGQEIGNNNERMTGRLSVTIRPSEKLTINAILNGAVGTTTGFLGTSPLTYATNTSRAIDPDAYYQQRSSYSYNSSKPSLGYNYMNERDNSGTKSRSSRLGASLDLKWRILDWMTYQFSGGYTDNNSTTESWYNEQTFYVADHYRGYDYNSVSPTSPDFKAAMLPFGGELYTNNTNQYSYNIQNKLQFSKEFDTDNRLNALVGMELRSSTGNGLSNTVWGYVPDRGERIVAPTRPEDFVPIGGNSSTGWGILDAMYNGRWKKTNTTNNFFSVFATAAYSFKNRYVVNANVRNDASNRFGQDANNRLDPTYSLGFSWRASEEEFMKKHVSWITMLNLRGTYGIQGNALTSISPELILIQSDLEAYYNRYYSTLSNIPNPNLSWERTKSWNFGMDLELFNMFFMNLEYYTRRSNAVISVILPYEYGTNTMERNGGVVYNKGVEYTLSFTPIQKRDYALNVTLNASKNWNKGGESNYDKQYEDYINGKSDQILKEGYPISGFWSFAFAGLDENGKATFNNLNVPEEERSKSIDPTSFLVYSGQTEPTFTGGLGLSFRYKSLTLNSNFALLLGHKRRLPSPYAQFEGFRTHMPTPTANIYRDLINRWKQPGDEAHTNIPGLPSGLELYVPLPNTEEWGTSIEMWEYSDAMVVNASFFRCRNLGLSWQMDRKWCEKIHAKNIALNFSVDNVFVVANKRFNGFDPELDNSVMPRTFSFGINIGF